MIEVIAFLKSACENPATLASLSRKSTPEEIVGIAREKGFVIRAADFYLAVKIIDAMEESAAGENWDEPPANSGRLNPVV